jgi:hypothetical protein
VSLTTKIFIVLVCLFSFIFTPMTIQFVAKSYNWKELAESYQNVVIDSQVHNRNVVALLMAEEQAFEDELGKTRDGLRGANEDNLALQQTLAETNAKNASLTSENLALQTTVKTQAVSVRVKTEENRHLTTVNEDLRGENDRLMTESIQLNDRNKELAAERLILERKLRMLEEENIAMRQENAQLRQGVAAGPEAVGPVAVVGAAEPVGPVSRSPIRGQITAVEGNIAEIDVGSADGVKRGMSFVVMRDEKYLGDLRIEDLEPRSAVGTLELTGQGAIRAGDNVRDRATLEAVR